MNNLGSILVPNTDPRPLVHWFLRRSLKVFTLYEHGGNLGHVTKLICINVHTHSPIKLSYELWFQMIQLFLRKIYFNFDI